MNISVVGTGYVGLVAGTCFAESGNDVICTDIDREKIGALQSGVVPIYEPGLEELLRRNVEEGRLRFSADIEEGVKASLINFIAVGTPPGPDGNADLSAVYEVARTIGRAMNGYKIVATKSTVPVGTAERIREIIARHTGCEFDVASNPEFLKEGAAVEDFMKPDRIIIGTENPDVAEFMKDLYAPFMRTQDRMILMNCREAEMTKYAANALLATKISFMNEMAGLCEKLGVDVEAVRKGMGSDPRIGYSFLFPGAGYGGSCFPKDTKAVIGMGHSQGHRMRILEAVEEVNNSQKELIARRIIEYFHGDLKGKTIAVWGLSFKPRTTDVREAPSLSVINLLLDAGAKVQAHDPKAMEEIRKLFGTRVELLDDNYEVLKGADALAVITEWNEFRRPNFEKMKALMRTPVIFDGRNIYNPRTLRIFGFQYFGIGRSGGESDRKGL